MRVQQGRAFSTVLYKNDVTDQPTSFFYGGKQSALFCCHGRIEMRFLWLLQNWPLRWRNIVWNRKAGAFVFQRTFLHLGGYSATNTKMRALFLNILLVISAVCSSPQATATTLSPRTQNLFGRLSANRDFPNVKTAPDSER